MPLALIGALIGAFLGFRRAKSGGGNRLDVLQYCAIYAIAGGLIGFIAAIVIVRTF